MINNNYKTTRLAFLGTRILNTPFWALFNMIPFILYKDLQASSAEITAVIILKPAVSLIALYWIANMVKRKMKLLGHVVCSHFLGYLPFFFFPFIEDPWFVVASFGFYMTMYRGAIPAWMEILKLNMPPEKRTRIFAIGTTCGYVGDALWPLLFGFLLDGYFQAWRWIFPASALVALLAIFLQLRLRVDQNGEEVARSKAGSPWKEALGLLKRRPDFTRFQIGFMLGGAGLMVMQPAFPQFFMGTLQLTYTELGGAIVLCKGIGIALASPLWARLIHRIDVFNFASRVTFLGVLFAGCCMAAKTHLAWLFGGYILYGVMQAGSELVWNMSGPIFSKDEDSSRYTSVGIMMQGLRGCFIPLIGGILTSSFSPFLVMALGAFLCFIATLQLQGASRSEIVLRKLKTESVS